MNSPVTQALSAFIERYEMAAEKIGLSFPRLPLDQDWVSECQARTCDEEGLASWRPVAQVRAVDFSGLENALELEIHPDVKAYYGSFWSGSLEATSSEGHVSLIQLWNPADFDRLIENLIGHALAKKRLKHALTIFFANTESESEYFLSVDNSTGEVLLEKPGVAPVQKVDVCLADFISRLSPSLTSPGIH